MLVTNQRATCPPVEPNPFAPRRVDSRSCDVNNVSHVEKVYRHKHHTHPLQQLPVSRFSLSPAELRGPLLRLERMSVTSQRTGLLPRTSEVVVGVIKE